jgi:hypothetical protein
MGRGVLCRYPSNLSRWWVIALLLNPRYRIKFLRRAARRGYAIDFLQQPCRRWTIGRLTTAMRNKNISRPIDQEITARLVDILFTVVLPLFTCSQQFKIQLQGRGRKHAPPGQARQVESLVGNALGIGQDRERPMVIVLVTDKLGRLGKRNNDNRNAATAEFRL